MHSYLRAIGFSELSNESETEKLLEEVFHDYTERHIARGKNDTYHVQIKKEYGPNMGIMLCGDLDEHGFHKNDYFPYFESSKVTTEEPFEIDRRTDGNSYAGVCDDDRVGVSIIFFLQNAVQYQRKQAMSNLMPDKMTLTFTGLSDDGMIILPIKKSQEPANTQQGNSAKRSQLLSAAKSGDEGAIESLTIEDMDLYLMISRRVFDEDLYTIVDTSFMPVGVECDLYEIVGNILDCKKVMNPVTHEEIFQLDLECNDMYFSICINEKDLLGEPQAGRRFKGNIWLQGKVNFD